MPHPERRWMVPALALALILSACGSHAPGRWQPSVHAVQRSPRGSWIIIEIDDGRRAYGELLAIDATARIAYLEMRGTLAKVPLSRIRRIELTFHKGEVGKVVAWGLTGTASTISHGILLILSAPTWLLATGIVAGVEGSGGTIRRSRGTYAAPPGGQSDGGGSLTADEFARLRKYARFPQGLPEGFTVQPTSAPSLTPSQMPRPAPTPPSSAPATPAQPAGAAPAAPAAPAQPADTAPETPPPAQPADTAPETPPARPTAPPAPQPPGR